MTTTTYPLGKHAMTVDPASDGGRAILDLFASVKAIEYADSTWPGTELVAVLSEWFDALGIDVDAPAPAIPPAPRDAAPDSATDVDAAAKAKLSKADVQGMDEGALYEALALIDEEVKRREEGSFADVVRAYLRDDADAELRADVEAGGGAVRLHFGTSEYDNGYFYDENDGELTLADGTTTDLDVSQTHVADALTELSQIARRDGGLTAHSELHVDLLTGVVEHR